MNIIIKVKETATLDRIEQLSRAIDIMQRTQAHTIYPLQIDGYADVIESIHKEAKKPGISLKA